MIASLLLSSLAIGATSEQDYQIESNSDTDQTQSQTSCQIDYCQVYNDLDELACNTVVLAYMNSYGQMIEGVGWGYWCYSATFFPAPCDISPTTGCLQQDGMSHCDLNCVGTAFLPYTFLDDAQIRVWQRMVSQYNM